MGEQFSSFPYISLIIFLPLVGALITSLLKDESENGLLLKSFGLGVMVVDAIITLPLYSLYDTSTADLQFVEKLSWIEPLGIHYFVGIDGISLLLILLTQLLSILAVLSAWSDIKKSVREFMVLMQVLLTGMLGTFLAFDIILFFVFWEAALIPMYFIVGIWGGRRRVYAAMKFLLYTMSGSLLMLIAIMYLAFAHYEQAGHISFDLLELYQTNLSFTEQVWLWSAFFLAFAIKVPMFPVHTWLPDAHVEAPTAGSVILAGVLLKMGTYGFVRFSLPLFPDASFYFIPFIFVLSVIAIIYAALVAMVQADMKKLVAYSSISHLGFITIGVFAMNVEGMQGAVLHMINHGIVSGALFMLVGMVYERRKSRMIADISGVSAVMPVYASFFLIVTLASVGLPGTNGFIGEFLCLWGVFKFEGATSAFPVTAVLATTGIILSACYMLWMYQKTMFGQVVCEKIAALKDINRREITSMVVVCALIFWIGFYPNALLSISEESVSNIVTMVNDKHQLYEAVSVAFNE